MGYQKMTDEQMPSPLWAAAAPFRMRTGRRHAQSDLPGGRLTVRDEIMQRGGVVRGDWCSERIQIQKLIICPRNSWCRALHNNMIA